MFRKSSLFVAGALVASLQLTALAGGPPWVSVPIDGVNAKNSQACAEKIGAALKDKIFPGSEAYSGVNIGEHNGQHYAMFHMQKDVTLSDVEAALRGTSFTIPRDKIRLFGHTVLEVQADEAQGKKLLADLESLNPVWVAESNQADKKLRVTLEMPYPAETTGGRPSQKSVGTWQKYQRNDFMQEGPKTDDVYAVAELPTYNTLRDTIAKSGGKLEDVRWSTQYACRAVGCIVAPNPTVAATKQ
jgi:hypothetical protein